MANRLTDQTSPYLRQHADNPVDWYPWGDEAFNRARADDKPLLVSIGYSACHWCHVMAHESFEDPEIAGVLNDLFVNVKVDREERPDIDAIYMEATQAMTGSGGWPMTVFVTPDGGPFFCGTYFPPERRHGRPSLLDVCRAVDDAWRNRRDDVETQAGQITEHLRRGLASNGEEVPGKEVLTAALRVLQEQHDDRWGGFGRAPKFPQASNLDLLLRATTHNGDATTLAMARTSLDAMAAGGIYDHLGGGFARYSVDNTWLVPHFEKMLYDQALLTRVYLHAWQLTGEPIYRQVLDETIGYVLRDLHHPDGGFYSAEDADSEGAEGRFYLWTADQIRAVLGEPLSELAIDWYGASEQGGFDGRNILNRIAHRGDLIRPPEIEEARQKLFEARARRVRPGLDDKVLTEWNGLMISSLAEAAAATGERAWLDAAVVAAEFLVHRLRDADRRWYRSWHANGGSQHPAFAADHAAVVDAFCRLGEATGQARWIAIARDAAESLCERFWDNTAGGFFTTTDDGERLVARQKDLTDDATPSANSLAANALLRLAALTGEENYRHHADGVLRLLGRTAGEYPTAFGHLLAAVDLATTGITEVVVAGDRPDLVSVVQRRWLPNAVLAWGEPYGSPLWEGRSDGRAYVCRDFVCNAPTAETDELARQLDTTTTAA